MDKPDRTIFEDLPFGPADIEFLDTTEAEKNQGIRKVKLTVIRAGLSKNLNFYSPKLLSELPKFIEAHPKMYLDHDMLGGLVGRSMREWAATITKVWYEADEEAVKAEARMTSNPNTAWLYEEIKADPKDVGCSIDARVRAHEEEVSLDGGKTKVPAMVVDNWVVLNSVDFVTYAAAGGGIERVAASEKPIDLLKLIVQSVIEANQTNKSTPKQEDASMDLEQLKKEHPEIVQSLLKEFEMTSSVKEKDEKLVTLEAEKSSLSEANASLKKDIETAQSKIKVLEDAEKDLRAKLDVYETQEKQAAHRKVIDEKIAETITKGTLKENQISDKFRELLYGIEDMDKINVLIAEREEAFSTSGPTDNGKRSEPAPKGSSNTMTDADFVAGVKAR